MYPAKPTAMPAVAMGALPAVAMGAPPPPVNGVPLSSPVVVSGAVAASQWSSGLCACFDDCGLCCVTCWCPCITFGRIAEMVDRGATSCVFAGWLYTVLSGGMCHWIYSCTYRTKMRAQFGLPDVGCCDCCVHCCCEPCALCQMYRELKARGLDPELGWPINANAGMYPPPPQGMAR